MYKNLLLATFWLAFGAFVALRLHAELSTAQRHSATHLPVQSLQVGDHVRVYRPNGRLIELVGSADNEAEVESVNGHRVGLRWRLPDGVGYGTVLQDVVRLEKR